MGESRGKRSLEKEVEVAKSPPKKMKGKKVPGKAAKGEPVAKAVRRDEGPLGELKRSEEGWPRRLERARGLWSADESRADLVHLLASALSHRSRDTPAADVPALWAQLGLWLAEDPSQRLPTSVLKSLETALESRPVPDVAGVLRFLLGPDPEKLLHRPALAPALYRLNAQLIRLEDVEGFRGLAKDMLQLWSVKRPHKELWSQGTALLANPPDWLQRHIGCKASEPLRSLRTYLQRALFNTKEPKDEKGELAAAVKAFAEQLGREGGRLLLETVVEAHGADDGSAGAYARLFARSLGETEAGWSFVEGLLEAVGRSQLQRSPKASEAQRSAMDAWLAELFKSAVAGSRASLLALLVPLQPDFAQKVAEEALCLACAHRELMRAVAATYAGLSRLPKLVKLLVLDFLPSRTAGAQFEGGLEEAYASCGPIHTTDIAAHLRKAIEAKGDIKLTRDGVKNSFERELTFQLFHLVRRVNLHKFGVAVAEPIQSFCEARAAKSAGNYYSAILNVTSRVTGQSAKVPKSAKPQTAEEVAAAAVEGRLPSQSMLETLPLEELSAVLPTLVPVLIESPELLKVLSDRFAEAPPATKTLSEERIWELAGGVWAPVLLSSLLGHLAACAEQETEPWFRQLQEMPQLSPDQARKVLAKLLLHFRPRVGKLGAKKDSAGYTSTLAVLSGCPLVKFGSEQSKLAIGCATLLAVFAGEASASDVAAVDGAVESGALPASPELFRCLAKVPGPTATGTLIRLAASPAHVLQAAQRGFDWAQLRDAYDKIRLLATQEAQLPQLDVLHGHLWDEESGRLRCAAGGQEEGSAALSALVAALRLGDAVPSARLPNERRVLDAFAELLEKVRSEPSPLLLYALTWLRRHRPASDLAVAAPRFVLGPAGKKASSEAPSDRSDPERTLLSAQTRLLRSFSNGMLKEMLRGEAREPRRLCRLCLALLPMELDDSVRQAVGASIVRLSVSGEAEPGLQEDVLELQAHLLLTKDFPSSVKQEVLSAGLDSLGSLCAASPRRLVSRALGFVQAGLSREARATLGRVAAVVVVVQAVVRWLLGRPSAEAGVTVEALRLVTGLSESGEFRGLAGHVVVEAVEGLHEAPKLLAGGEVGPAALVGALLRLLSPQALAFVAANLRPGPQQVLNSLRRNQASKHLDQ